MQMVSLWVTYSLKMPEISFFFFLLFTIGNGVLHEPYIISHDMLLYLLVCLSSVFMQSRNDEREAAELTERFGGALQ